MVTFCTFHAVYQLSLVFQHLHGLTVDIQFGPADQLAVYHCYYSCHHRDSEDDAHAAICHVGEGEE